MATGFQREDQKTNGLKCESFTHVTDLWIRGPAELKFVKHRLNNLPRKSFGWDSPAERLRGLFIAS